MRLEDDTKFRSATPACNGAVEEAAAPDTRGEQTGASVCGVWWFCGGILELLGLFF